MELIAGDDEFAWLEEIDSVRALDWVRARNAETVAEVTGSPGFARLEDDLRQVFDSDDRIPYPSWRGDLLYTFWQDKANPRGLWRRTTLEEYSKADPRWEVLVDVDALAQQEGENWVWNTVTVRRPGHDRALISLSRGGSDAVEVREFDLASKAFVPGGFTLPEAKSRVGWIDEDTIFVGTDFSPGTMTSSGYPRLVKRWRRGTPLSEAQLVFEGEHGDVSVSGGHDPTPGFERSFVRRWTDFYNNEGYFLHPDGRLVLVEVPTDAQWEAHERWLLVRLRTEWEVAGRVYAAGCLVVIDFDGFLAGARDFTVLYEPDERSALDSWAWTKNHLIVSTLVDVASRLEAHTPTESGWRRAPLTGLPDLGHSWIVSTQEETSDAYLVASSGFLQPATLQLGQFGDGAGPRELKRSPAFFDTDGMRARQLFATSEDGTRVPYFVIGDADATGPALLTAYGGFAQAKTPDYDAAMGRGWLARGGTYVVANIRGGGEYGPRWHHAALRDKRPRAFEDLAAVADDLARRGIAEPAQLGVFGRSNGGLLTGAMLTRYPEKFGAIVIGVPLLDMRRYHQLLAGASWMAEYGDPDNPGDWAFLRTFSPYQNVAAGRPYPPVLLFTSTRDDRVHPGHARKMAARLLALGYEVTYYENLEGGHASASDNKQKAFMTALRLDFVWKHTSRGG